MFPPRQRRFSVSAEADKDNSYQQQVFPKSDEQRIRILSAISGNFLFEGLESSQTNCLIDAMQEKLVKEGDTVIKQGEPGDFLYIIEHGDFSVFKRGPDGADNQVFAYKGIGSFGELALMYNCPRAATVKAATEGCLWALDRKTFKHILVDSNQKKRRLYEEFLENVPVLSKLTMPERAMVADCLVSQTFDDGDVVIEQGEESTSSSKFYIIEEGEAVALQIPDGKTDPVEVGRMKRKDYFGERALLTDQPRAASVVAVGTLKVVTMDRATFERLLGECRDVMQRQIAEYVSAK